MKRDSICPVCNGTGRIPAGEIAVKYGWHGFDKQTGTQYCTNCGPKGMFAGAPDGKTTARPDGTPCEHEFIGKTIGRCYHEYSCKHCNYSYTIDSGD